MDSDITRTFERGNLHELAAFVVTPARSGIFLTRSRIRALAQEMGLRAGVQSRARMLENLFREAGADGRVPELIGRIDAVAAENLARCRAWSKACPPSKAAWRTWSKKTQALRRHLAKAQKWARTMKEEPGPAESPPRP